MQANIGDQIKVRSRKVGAPTRLGVVVGFRGEAGHPPFLVQWNDTAGEHVFYPGSDTLIEPPAAY